MDFRGSFGKLAGWTAQECVFVRDRVTEENMARSGKNTPAGDLLIDSPGTSTPLRFSSCATTTACLYINTSTELWDPYAAGPKQHPTEKTLYWRHMNLRRMLADVEGKRPDAVIEQRCEPRLISHFVKQGPHSTSPGLIVDKKVKAKARRKDHRVDQYPPVRPALRAVGVKSSIAPSATRRSPTNRSKSTSS